MPKSKGPRKVQRSQGGQVTRSRESNRADNFDRMTPAWSFSVADEKGSEKLPAGSDCHKWCGEILPKLKNFESMTWAEIKSQTYSGKRGRRKTSNHYVDTDKLPRDAKRRLRELKQNDLEQLFSLRLKGKVRLYGIIEGRIMKILWYDPEHRLYPSNLD